MSNSQLILRAFDSPIPPPPTFENSKSLVNFRFTNNIHFDDKIDKTETKHKENIKMKTSAK